MKVSLEIILEILAAVLALALALRYWFHQQRALFKSVDFPYLKSNSIFGAFSGVLTGKQGFYDTVLELYNRKEVKDSPFFGIFLFHKPGLVVNDPELIKRILVKDFHSFSNRYAASDVHDPLGNYNLFSVKAPLWKNLRSKLSPFFSSGKLKTMYYLLDKVSNEMVEFINRKLDKDGEVELEMKELASLYSTDVIASCAFGVEANSLRNPEGEFRKAGSSVFKMTFWRGLEFPTFFMLPKLMKIFRFHTFSTECTKFIQKIVPSVIEDRIAKGNKRNDLIDTIIELKKTDESLTDDILMAQAAVFFSAGFETSSATQSFAFYEIAKNANIQNRLREEIREMLKKTGGKVNYDSIMNTTEMPYLHQIVHETLRMYPVLAILDRECTAREGYSLEPFSDFKVPYGMPIYIPFYAIQRDEKHFPDPLKFDPERFSPENAESIQAFTNFPFGSGPRNCIGERFGLMQVKTGLVKILKDFKVEVTENTPEKIVFEKTAMLIQSEKGLYLNLVKDPLSY